MAIGRSIVASCAPSAAGTPKDCTSVPRAANGASCMYDWRRAAASDPGVIGSSIRATSPDRRAAIAVASFISSIGVIPAIASVGKAPIE